MKPGKNSTEFYVALVVVGAWALKYLGIDISFLQPDDINQIRAAIADNGDNALGAFAGIAYVIGRSWIKAKESDKSKTQPKAE